MRNRFCLTLLVFATAACDRVTSPSIRDGGPDSVAALWENVDAGTVNYNAVAGSAPENVFIVGDQGTILHWDGVTLAPEASGTAANLRGVAVVDETLAYAVGEQGTVLSRQAGVWALLPPLTTAVLNAVWASADYAVVVGEQGTILHLGQSGWQPVDHPCTDKYHNCDSNYYAVTDAADAIAVVGVLGVVDRIDARTGKVGTPVSIPSFVKTLAGGARYGAGAFLVGVDGAFFYLANRSATSITGLPQKFLRAVSVLGDTAWIVGHEGLVATASLSGRPTLIPTPDDRWLLGVYAASATDVWVVGRSGLILRGPPGVRGVDGGVP
jgi:hypothetical protein